jgi:Mg/Co/Ni transporter MgtE
VRRLGPYRWRAHATPDQVIDWGAIQHFAGPPGQLQLSEARGELRRLRPGELADLLERLGRVERQALLDEVGAEAAADALEEMEPEELQVLLRESSAERAAELIASMEPDEAADALRPLEADHRLDVLAALPREVAAQLAQLAAYPETTAGGCMTSRLVLCRADDTVDDVRARLRDETDHQSEIDSILIVDDDGQLVDDISLFELLIAEADAPLESLVGQPLPVTVTVDQPLDEVVEALVENRAASLVVIDDDGCPVGRILADDVVDALISDKGRVRFPRILR